MTAIPEPTEEDLEFARDMLNSLEKRPEIALMEDFCSMWLVLAHYHRENERLARQRHVLEKACREHAADYVSAMKIVAANHPDTTESASTEWEVAKEFIDALSGEGGAR